MEKNACEMTQDCKLSKLFLIVVLCGFLANSAECAPSFDLGPHASLPNDLMGTHQSKQQSDDLELPIVPLTIELPSFPKIDLPIKKPLMSLELPVEGPTIPFQGILQSETAEFNKLFGEWMKRNESISTASTNVSAQLPIVPSQSGVSA